MAELKSIRTLQCQDIMTRRVETLSPGVTVREAAAAMIAMKIGSLVVTSRGKVIGIFTEKDVARSVAQGMDPDSTLLERVITTPVISIRSTDLVIRAVEKMAWYHVRHLPAIDPPRGLRGLLSDRDLFDQIADLVDLFTLVRVMRTPRRTIQLMFPLPDERDLFQNPVRAGDIALEIPELPRNATLSDAAKSIRNYSASCVMQMNDDGPGVLTAHDLVKAIADGGSMTDPMDELVTRPIVAYPPFSTLGDISRRMVNDRLRHFMVHTDAGLRVIPDKLLLSLVPQFVQRLEDPQDSRFDPYDIGYEPAP